MKTDYPAWICSDCAEKNNGRWPDGHIGTFHHGICGWCKEQKSVTQPRDYGYPQYKEKIDATQERKEPESHKI